MKKISLYIHIPFCRSKCNYCNFCSFAIQNEDDEIVSNYVDCLLQEIKMYSQEFSDYLVDTIFIGGGTPSILPKQLMTKIINELYSSFNISRNVEFTIEANPDSVTEEKLKLYSSLGVNRLSMGLQSSNDRTLKFLNRPHDLSEYINALKIAKKYFSNINTDILLGLPNDSKKDVKKSLDILIKHKVTHISAYGLILEKNTKLYDYVIKNNVVIDEEKSVSLYYYVVEYLKKFGYNQYEISNFSLSNFECRHNLNYWRRQDYLGLGLNSHSCINNQRQENEKNLKKYENAIKNHQKPIKKRKKLSKTDNFIEYIMLSLRTSDGVDNQYMIKNFNKNLFLDKKLLIDNLQKNKLVTIVNEKLFCTTKGFGVSNEIILQLIE